MKQMKLCDISLFQTLQLLDPSEAQSALGLVPHDLKYSSTLSLDTRTRPQMEFMDALFQVVQKLLPDHRVVRATDRDHHLSIDGSSVTVEVTTFEPLQEILITWGIKVTLQTLVVVCMLYSVIIIIILYSV